MAGTNRTLTYQYDANGNRIRITHPDGTFFTATYDGLGRPSWAYDQTGYGLLSFWFNNRGEHVGLSRGNGAGTSFGYDAIGRMNLLDQAMAGTAADATWTFSRNPAGQIASQIWNNGVYAWTGHYAVDRAYTTDGLNRYTAAGAASYAYDANGNLTWDGSRQFDYDVENRLIWASGASSTTLVYDPLGRLFQLTHAGTSTQFLYDGDALVAEYDNAGEMIRRHVHSIGADVPVVTYENHDLATPHYLYADHQGSIVALAGASGAVFQINTYDEYGIPGTANAGRFQYTGQIWLPSLGMYHYKARVYSPTLGRFMQTDPIGYQDQVNLYAYVGNDPVNATDPTGTTCTETVKGADCKIDDPGSLNKDELMQATQAYTDAVNTLLANPDHRESITLAGVTIEVTARQVAEGLMRSDVHGGDGRVPAQTVGGQIHPEGGTSDGRPVITINRIGLQQQEVGNFAERERARIFVHEGIHTVPQERAFAGMRDFNNAHQPAYRAATIGFYGR